MTAASPKQILLVGTSFKRVGFEQLASYVLPPDGGEGSTRLCAALEADELVYLSTCNRVECYVAYDAPPSNADLATRFAAFFNSPPDSNGGAIEVLRGAEVVEHLFATAGSLESLVVGESDIVRQVRRAADEASQRGHSGPVLERLFERASQSAKRVRRETTIGETSVSVASLAVEKITKHFGEEGPGVTLLVGVGAMTRKVAGALRSHASDLIFVNRTLEGAEALAREFGGRAVALAELTQQPPVDVDLIFTATSAPEPILGAAELGPTIRAHATGAPLIVCDMGVPRDVDPTLEGTPGLLLVALEHLELLARMNRSRLGGEVDEAWKIVREDAARLLREERFRRLADESALAFLTARLGHLPDADRDTILKFATGLAERFARQPEDLR